MESSKLGPRFAALMVKLGQLAFTGNVRFLSCVAFSSCYIQGANTGFLPGVTVFLLAQCFTAFGRGALIAISRS